MDMFTEYIVKRKKEAKDYILSVVYVIVALVMSIVIFAFGLPIPMLSSIVTLLVIGVWYVAVRLIKNKNIEYEYTLTNGELDIDKIIARRQRKRIISVHCRVFETFAPIENKTFKSYSSLKIIDTAKSKNSSSAYFAVFGYNGERICLIFEVSGNMLKIIKKYVGNRAVIRVGDDE